MEYFEVEGGYPLNGQVYVQGAKNEALPAIAACLLTPHPVVIRNVPRIVDVTNLIGLLSNLGVCVSQEDEHTFCFRAEHIDLDYLRSDECIRQSRALRGSLVLVGPLLGRLCRAYLLEPGGDKIGRRRVDTHLLGLQELGVTCSRPPGQPYYELTTSGLVGKYILLEEASVTGTANVILAAVRAKGTTTLYNAACEPYIQQLCKMLQQMGACIEGVGSNLLHITGVQELGGAEHTLLPDMIEVGSFIGLAAMTSGEITIKNAGVQHLGIIPRKFEQLGIQLHTTGDDIHVSAKEVYEIHHFLDGSILTLYDHPWPGLTPDLLSVLLVVATQAKGSVLIHQKMFESRLFFTDKLIDMGAKIILCDPHRAVVIGLARQYSLRAITMSSPDIRAGVTLLLAALNAQGTSQIFNIQQIDRGYENIEQRLQALGARIRRVQV